MALTRITKGVIKPNENYDTHNINSTGIVTATRFVGPVTGAITGTAALASGLTGTPSITVQDVVAVGATFTGNVSIGGTLTYEDVTNIDSVGIITARSAVSIGDSINHIGNTGTSIRFPAADTFSVETAGSEKARITSGGNLLLGTDTETNNIRLGNKFGIAGTTAYTGMSITNYSGTTAAYKPLFDFNRSRGSSDGSFVAVQADDGLGEILFRGSGTSAFADAAAIRAHVDTGTGTAGNADMPGKLTFWTSKHGQATVVERLRIDSAGHLSIPYADNGTGLRQKIRFVTEANYFDEVAYISADRTAVSNAPTDLVFATGDVTAGVHQRLRIKSDGDIVVGNFTPVDTRNTGGIHIQDNHGISFKSHSSAASRNWRIRNDDFGWGNLDFGVGTSNSDFADAAGEIVLSLTSNRRVGINEVSPDSMLHLTAANDSSSIRLENTADTPDNVWEIIPAISGVSNTGFTIRDVTDSANRLVIDGSGNIGVGIDAPTFSSINSITANSARGIEIFKDGTDTGSAIKLAGDNGGGTKSWSQLGYSGANATSHWANYNTAGTKTGEIVIGSTGKVGIGTDNPSKTLTIFGASSSSFRISKSGVLAYDHTFDGSTYTIANNNGSAGIPIVIGTKTSGQESLRITSDGKLLIGINASTSGDGQIQSFKPTGNNSTIVVGNVATSASGLCRYDFCPSNSVVGARIECHATEDFASVANRTADLVFVTRKDGTNSEKLRITSTGAVNIGSSSSVLTQTTYKFQVETTTNKKISFDNAAHDDLSDEGAGIIFSRPSDGADRISGIFQHTNMSLGVASRGGLTFHTGGSSFYSATDERLRIASDGKILMGVAANNGPAAPLHIYGGSNTTPILAFTRSSTHDDWQGGGIGLVDEGGTYKGALTFYTHSSSGTKNDSITEKLRITSSGSVNIGDNYSQSTDLLHVNSFGMNKEAIGIGASSEGIRLGWEGDNSAYDSSRIYRTDYSTSEQFGMGASWPCMVITPTTAPGSGTSNESVWLKSTGRGSGSTQMHLTVDGTLVVGGNGKVNGGTTSGYPNSRRAGLGDSKFTIQPDDRTSAFDASDGDTWHDVVLKQTGSATNNAVGIAFETSTSGYHKNAGTGIACVKNGTNSDYGSDLVFVTRPQSLVASEKVRIYAHQGIKMKTNATSTSATSWKASQSGVGYGVRTRIYPYWVSADTNACRFNFNMGPASNINTPRFWIFTNAVTDQVGEIMITANRRVNSPNNAQQRYHQSKWSVGMYGEGDNDFSAARWNKLALPSQIGGNTMDVSNDYAGSYYVATNHGEYNTNANQYQNGYGGWYWHIQGPYWQAHPVTFDCYFAAGGDISNYTWYAYIDD